jgi:glutaredoxin
MYSNVGCVICGRVREVLKRKGFTVEDRDSDTLMKGTDRNMEAMAQLAMQNMELPLVMVDGMWRKPREVIAWGV